MSRNELLELMKDVINYIVPEISTDNLSFNDSLKEIGANSIDRAEIIIMLMEDSNVKLPMVSFGQAKNIGEIIDIIVDAS